MNLLVSVPLILAAVGSILYEFFFAIINVGDWGLLKCYFEVVQQTTKNPFVHSALAVIYAKTDCFEKLQKHGNQIIVLRKGHLI